MGSMRRSPRHARAESRRRSAKWGKEERVARIRRDFSAVGLFPGGWICWHEGFDDPIHLDFVSPRTTASLLCGWLLRHDSLL